MKTVIVVSCVVLFARVAVCEDTTPVKIDGVARLLVEYATACNKDKAQLTGLQKDEVEKLARARLVTALVGKTLTFAAEVIDVTGDGEMYRITWGGERHISLHDDTKLSIDDARNIRKGDMWVLAGKISHMLPVAAGTPFHVQSGREAELLKMHNETKVYCTVFAEGIDPEAGSIFLLLTDVQRKPLAKKK